MIVTFPPLNLDSKPGEAERLPIILVDRQTPVNSFRNSQSDT